MFLIQIGSSSVALPSPEVENTESLPLSTNVRRSINGGFYTTKKTDSGEKILSYSFRQVALVVVKLLHSTILANPAGQYTLVDHNDQQWSARLVGDPFPSTIDGMFGDSEEGSFEIQFRGVTI